MSWWLDAGDVYSEREVEDLFWQIVEYASEHRGDNGRWAVDHAQFSERAGFDFSWNDEEKAYTGEDLSGTVTRRRYADLRQRPLRLHGEALVPDALVYKGSAAQFGIELMAFELKPFRANMLSAIGQAASYASARTSKGAPVRFCSIVTPSIPRSLTTNMMRMARRLGVYVWHPYTHEYLQYTGLLQTLVDFGASHYGPKMVCWESRRDIGAVWCAEYGIVAADDFFVRQYGSKLHRFRPDRKPLRLIA